MLVMNETSYKRRFAAEGGVPEDADREQTCPYCNGARQVLTGNLEMDCPRCDGTGVIENTGREHETLTDGGIGATEERGRAPDSRDIADLVAIHICRHCRAEPAVVIISKDGNECYHCGGDLQ